MTPNTFVRRGLRYFRSSYWGVLAGAALGAMVLLGALFAGDSVRGTLQKVTEARIGGIDSILTGGDRFFRAALAAELADDGITAAPVLFIEGTVGGQKTERSSGMVQILGVDEHFWTFAPKPVEPDFPVLSGREVFVNEPLAKQLGVQEGETVVMRFAKPGLLSRDAPMSGSAESVITIRGTVKRVVADGEFGRFGLEASQLQCAHPTPLTSSNPPAQWFALAESVGA